MFQPAPRLLPAVPWTPVRVRALLIGVVTGIAAVAAVFLAAWFASPPWSSYIFSGFGASGAFTGYYTYKAAWRRAERLPGRCAADKDEREGE